jgi:hypothetical protein
MVNPAHYLLEILFAYVGIMGRILSALNGVRKVPGPYSIM